LFQLVPKVSVTHAFVSVPSKNGDAGWHFLMPLLLAAAVRSFAHMLLGISGRNKVLQLSIRGSLSSW